MDLLKPVSGRQFAKMVGQSEGAVRKAISRCSIVEGLTADKKIIPITASNEWGKAILPEFLNDAPVVRKMKTAPVARVQKSSQTPVFKIPTTKTPRKSKPEPTTADEFLEEVMSEKLPVVSEKEIEDDEEIDPDDISKPEAERQAAIVKVKILRLAYEEKRGQMVPIAKVNTVLFGYGQEIRTAVEGMPNRVLDKIMGASNRHEAKKIFEREIYETLNLLADIQERKFE
jgi:hypothetical protein